MSDRTVSYLALLVCGHMKDGYPPAPIRGDVIWCIRCAEYRVVERLAGQAHWTMVCFDCDYVYDPTGFYTKNWAHTSGKRHSLIFAHVTHVYDVDKVSPKVSVYYSGIRLTDVEACVMIDRYRKTVSS